MSEAPRPYTLIAELTYRCPLRCAYCSNPVSAAGAPALETEHWLRVLGEAEALGVVHVHFTGGEPLLRADLEALVARARALDLYTNLITSGVPLTRARLAGLRDAGLESVQLSLQGARGAEGDAVAGRACAAHKLEVAGWVKELGLPLTINVVLHRGNIDEVEEVVALAERLGADRLELAHAQYLGWALLNRAALLPGRDAVERARAAGALARERLRGRMEVISVLPDVHADRPRACMEGWGRRYLVVSPDGLALPCHAARDLPGLRFENVRERGLREIWERSAGFEAFRGEGWMQEPCRSCERRSIDFGGCRCQAFHLVGDAAAADPACRLSPRHDVIQRARSAAEGEGRGPVLPRSLPRFLG